MKLFQIEEPDGAPVDPDAAGVAVGIDAGGRSGQVAIAVGGNAALLADRDGFEQELPTPSANAPDAAWQAFFEGARLRAERALAQPVTHAVVALAERPDAEFAARLTAAGDAAGLALLRLLGRGEIPEGEAPALIAAMLAEDLAPRPDMPPDMPLGTP